MPPVDLISIKDLIQAVSSSSNIGPIYKSQILKKLALLERYKKSLEGLTSGGSEFVDDPEFCEKHIKSSRETHLNMIKELVPIRNLWFQVCNHFGLKKPKEISLTDFYLALSTKLLPAITLIEGVDAYFQKLEDETDKDDPLLEARRRYHKPLRDKLKEAKDILANI